MHKFTLLLMALFYSLSVSAEMATLRLYTDVTSAFFARQQSIRSSKNKINIESFYLENDEIGRSLLKSILIQKNKNPKMNVRLLLDAWGSETLSERHVCALIKIGQLQVRLFNRGRGLFNQVGTHRKIWLTDNIAIVGGRNLGNENLADFALPKPVYSDWDIELTHSSTLTEIQNSFEQAWTHSLSKIPNCNEDRDLQAVSDEIISEKYEPKNPAVLPNWYRGDVAWFTDPVGEPKQRPVLNKVLALLKDAYKNIEVESAFFIPVGKISTRKKSSNELLLKRPSALFLVVSIFELLADE